MSFKIAVVGCGWVSMDCHGPAYRRYADQHAGIELTACCDRDPARADEFRERFGFKHACSDYLAMLEMEHPSAVCLNVPEKMIAAIGVEILNRGHPLLAEKPPGLTQEEVGRLIAAAEASQAINMVAFNRRHMPLMVRLKNWLTGRQIHAIHYQMARVGRTNDDFSTTGIHAVDTTRFLAGADYLQIHFRYQDLHALGAQVANFQLDCLFENGSIASIALNPVSGINVERVVVHCPENTFLLNCNNGPDAPGSLKHYQKGQLLTELDGWNISGSRESYILDGFYAEDAAFFDAVRTGVPVRDDLQSALQSVEIMQHMRERAPAYMRK